MPSKITLYQEGEDDVPTPATGAKTLFLGTDDAFKTKDSSGVVDPIEMNLANSNPLPLGTASAGNTSSASRSNHVHAHGNQAGGSLHPLATTTNSGFLSSSEKIKLNAISNEITTHTTSATLVISSGTVLADCTGGNLTFTLPPAAGASLAKIRLKKIDSSANTATFDGDGSETIDDATVQTVSTRYETMEIQSDGVEWWVTYHSTAS